MNVLFLSLLCNLVVQYVLPKTSRWNMLARKTVAVERSKGYKMRMRFKKLQVPCVSDQAHVAGIASHR